LLIIGLLTRGIQYFHNRSFGADAKLFIRASDAQSVRFYLGRYPELSARQSQVVLAGPPDAQLRQLSANSANGPLWFIVVNRVGHQDLSNQKIDRYF